MRSLYHFAATLPLFISAYVSGGFYSSILTLFFGWLIDCDHEVDAYMRLGGFINPLNLSRELSTPENSKGYWPLHGWEYIPVIMYLVNSVLGCNASLYAVSAYFIHLALDSAFNGYPLRAYSIVWRMCNRWFVNCSLPSNYVEAWPPWSLHLFLLTVALTQIILTLIVGSPFINTSPYR